MIYFILAGRLSLTKIGFAKTPHRRIHNLRVGSPVELTLVRLLDGTMADEKRIHADLAQHRVRGEWFALTAEQVAGDFGLADVPLKPVPPTYIADSSPDPVFHQAVEDAISRHAITPSFFGGAAVGDPSFVLRLRRGRETRASTRAKALAFIGRLDRALESAA